MTFNWKFVVGGIMFGIGGRLILRLFTDIRHKNTLRVSIALDVLFATIIIGGSIS
jgi:hypothetical protein